MEAQETIKTAREKKGKKKTTTTPEATAAAAAQAEAPRQSPYKGHWEPWRVQKEALKAKFPEGWKPLKKLSPDARVGIRALHQQYPDLYTTEVLSEKFALSAEAIRRILRSKWTPTTEEDIERQERWFNRGKSVWAKWAALGTKPPQKWRREGIDRDDSFYEKRAESELIDPFKDPEGWKRQRDARGFKKLSESLM